MAGSADLALALLIQQMRIETPTSKFISLFAERLAISLKTNSHSQSTHACLRFPSRVGISMTKSWRTSDLYLPFTPFHHIHSLSHHFTPWRSQISRPLKVMTVAPGNSSFNTHRCHEIVKLHYTSTMSSVRSLCNLMIREEAFGSSNHLLNALHGIL